MTPGPASPTIALLDNDGGEVGRRHSDGDRRSQETRRGIRGRTRCHENGNEGGIGKFDGEGQPTRIVQPRGQRADELLAAGDMEGRRVWHRIEEAIDELGRTAPGHGEGVH